MKRTAFTALTAPAAVIVATAFKAATKVLAAAMVLAVASCTKEPTGGLWPCNPGDEIHFAASRTATAQGTKAAYDGTDDLHINWQDGD